MKEIMKFSELEYAKTQGKGLNLDALKRNRNKQIDEENTLYDTQKATNDFELAPL
jgi:hypothetical protein